MKPCKAEGSGVEESNRESELSAHPLSITSSDQSVLVKYNSLCHGPPLCGVISPEGRLDFDRGWRGPSLQRGQKWRIFHQQFRFLESQVNRIWYKNVLPALNYFQIRWSLMYNSTCQSLVCCRFSDKCLFFLFLTFSAVFQEGAKILHYLFISVTFSTQLIETQCYHHSYLGVFFKCLHHIKWSKAERSQCCTLQFIYIQQMSSSDELLINNTDAEGFLISTIVLWRHVWAHKPTT